MNPESLAQLVCSSLEVDWKLEEACEFVIAAAYQCETISELSHFKARFDTALRTQSRLTRSSLYDFTFLLCTSEQQKRLLEIFSQTHHAAMDGEDSTDLCVSSVILSDIDDTLHAFYKDRRYPRGAIYPGVTQFFVELARHRNQNNSKGKVASDAIPGMLEVKLGFVTARPSWMRGMTEAYLANSGFEYDLLLMGTTASILSHASMIKGKLDHCERMRQLYPECTIFFVGDNGQADIDMGKQGLDLGFLDTVFIHDIFDTQYIDNNATSGKGPSGKLDSKGSRAKCAAREYETQSKSEEDISDMSNQSKMKNSRKTSTVASHGKDPFPVARHHSTPTGWIECAKWNTHISKLEHSRSFHQRYRGAECMDSGIILFQSYAGAAISAHSRGLISADGATRVLLASASECRQRYHKSVREGILQQTARWIRTLEDNEALELMVTIHQLFNYEPFIVHN